MVQIIMSKYRRSYFQHSASANTIVVRDRLDVTAHPQKGLSSIVERLRGLRGTAARVAAVGVLFAMGATYLAIIGTSSYQGFDFLDREKKIATLQKENQRLELRAIELESVERIDREAAELGLMQPERVVYLPDSSTPPVAVIE